MAAIKPASLPTNILAKKAPITPSALHDVEPPANVPVVATPPVAAPAEPEGRLVQLSVNVSQETFERFSMARVKTRKKGQPIINEAILDWLEKNKF